MINSKEFIKLINDSNKYKIFVVMDDCPYSGRQLVNDIILQEFIVKMLSEEHFKKIKVFVAVPYISSYAKEIIFSKKLKEMKEISKTTEYLYFPKNINYFKNFWQLCLEKKFNPFVYDVLYSDPYEYEEDSPL